MSGWREFLGLTREWDALAAGDPDGALLSHGWTAQCWKSSGAVRRWEQPCILWLRGGESGQLQAVLALRHSRRRRHLRFLEDVRSQRLNLLARPAAEAAGWQFVGQWLSQRRDWDRCDLRSLPVAAAACARAGLEGAGLTVRERGASWQRRIRLAVPWAEVEAGFSAELRSNFRRRRKRLEAQGRLELTVVEQAQGLRAHLAECLQLEQAGWKGDQGTAVLDSPGTARFYQRLAFRLAALGQLRIFCLRLNQRLIAFEYCLSDPHTTRLHSLKIAYDEQLRACSPGTVLRWLLLQQAHASGMASYEMLGEDARWKADWTRERIELRHLRVYNRTLRGRGWWWRARCHAAVIRGYAALPAAWVIRASQGW